MLGRRRRLDPGCAHGCVSAATATTATTTSSPSTAGTDDPRVERTGRDRAHHRGHDREPEPRLAMGSGTLFGLNAATGAQVAPTRSGSTERSTSRRRWS